MQSNLASTTINIDGSTRNVNVHNINGILVLRLVSEEDKQELLDNNVQVNIKIKGTNNDIILFKDLLNIADKQEILTNFLFNLFNQQKLYVRQCPFIVYELPTLKIDRYLIEFEIIEIPAKEGEMIEINLELDEEQLQVMQKYKVLVLQFIQQSKQNLDEAKQVMSKVPKQVKGKQTIKDQNDRNQILNQIAKQFTQIVNNGNQMLSNLRKQCGKQQNQVELLQRRLGYEKLINLNLETIPILSDYACYLQIIINFYVAKAMKNTSLLNQQYYGDEKLEKAYDMAFQAVNICEFEMQCRVQAIGCLIRLNRMEQAKELLIDLRQALIRYNCEAQFKKLADDLVANLGK